MRSGISGKYRRSLARGAAIALAGGLMAGCSSDVMRFQDPGLTSNYGTNQPVQTAQTYSDNYGAGVDGMSTASITQKRGGILQRAGIVSRSQNQGAVYSAAPAAPSYPANNYPAAASSNLPPVSSGPALAPVTRSSLGNTAQSTAAPQPVYNTTQPQPIRAPERSSSLADSRSPTGTRNDVTPTRTPTPSKAPDQRVAVLPQQPGLNEKAKTSAQSATASGTPSFAGDRYTVAAGDTLHAISRKTGASTEAIMQANGLSNGLIRVGQALKIPNGKAPAGGSVAAAPVQTVSAKPKTDPTTTAAVQRPDNSYTPPKPTKSAVQQASVEASAPAPNASGISKLRWPVRGRVISGFGGASGGKSNDGIDIAVPAGTAVKAAENGVVIYAGDGLKEFGNTVLVRHENGLVTVYGHASELKVQRGQKVRRGEDIALAGMSGSADTPKLHFEVRKDSSPVDPGSFLE